MAGGEFRHLLAKREGAQAHGVELVAIRGQQIASLAHTRFGGAEIDNAELAGPAGVANDGLGHELRGGGEFARQPVEVFRVERAVLDILGEAVMGGAAGEKGALGGVRSRQRAVRNGVAVNVAIAAEFLATIEGFGIEHLAAVVNPRIVPLKRVANPVIHADVQIAHDDDRRLQALRQIEGVRRQLKTFFWIAGEQQHMLGVAVRSIGARGDVGLLRACRHAGRGTATLDIEQHQGQLREIGEAEKFRHQRYAGTRGRGESARAVPARADDDADCRQLVLGLNNRHPAFPILVETQAPGMALEGFRQ